jgi:Fe-S-cluster containining protein
MSDRADVPCGACRLCCTSGQAIPLQPEKGDDLLSYDFRFIKFPDGKTHPVLNHKPNGDCVYLGDGGCTIHERAPLNCRMFDCRTYFKSFTKAQRVQMVAKGATANGIFEEGRKRLSSLRQR